jgi:hypothetical protein
VAKLRRLLRSSAATDSALSSTVLSVTAQLGRLSEQVGVYARVRANGTMPPRLNRKFGGRKRIGDLVLLANHHARAADSACCARNEIDVVELIEPGAQAVPAQPQDGAGHFIPRVD